MAIAMPCACTSPPQPQGVTLQSRQSRPTSTVVEAADLPSVIADATKPLVILDVRPEQAYAAGHIDGAVRVDHGEWESDSLGEAKGLNNGSLWRSRIGDLGIDGRGTVVIYDSGSMTDAARVWLILQSFGAEDVRVVNGGFPLIADAVRAGAITLSTQGAPPHPVAFGPAATGPDRIELIDRKALKALIDAGRMQILDARSAKEFEGSDLRGNPRGGHLPGATSVPHSSMLDSRRRLKSPEALAALFAAAGIRKGEPLVTHCQAGGRAALAALAAERAGYGPVSTYYLSFGDWSADSTCPVVAP